MYINIFGKEWCCIEMQRYVRLISHTYNVRLILADKTTIREFSFRERRVECLVIEIGETGIIQYIDIGSFIGVEEYRIIHQRIEAWMIQFPHDIPAPAYKNWLCEEIRRVLHIEDDLSATPENHVTFSVNFLSAEHRELIFNLLRQIDGKMPDTYVEIDLNMASARDANQLHDLLLRFDIQNQFTSETPNG